MDRRQRKREQKKKKRELAKKKKKARGLIGGRERFEERLIAAAARGPFGPCAVSLGWDDAETEPPPLVQVVVSRRLADGDLVAGSALVDRTCLGVKNALVEAKLSDAEFDELLEEFGDMHGGMEICEPMVAQSIVYGAIDYARRLGFEPHRDFPDALFGPRPETLIETPMQARPRPLYVAGPHDDPEAILSKLEEAVGADGFDFVPGPYDDDDDDYEDEDDEDGEEDGDEGA